MNKSGNFVIRVYGLIINQKNEILLSDEFQMGMKMTKFPGGGLEFGEGIIDCLRREFYEECSGQKIKNLRHFYTCDFYQKAFFYENHQLISIYYLAELQTPVQFKISDKHFDFENMKNGNQSFRWANLDDLNETQLTFSIDKTVLGKIKSIQIK